MVNILDEAQHVFKNHVFGKISMIFCIYFLWAASLISHPSIYFLGLGFTPPRAFRLKNLQFLIVSL